MMAQFPPWFSNPTDWYLSGIWVLCFDTPWFSGISGVATVCPRVQNSSSADNCSSYREIGSNDNLPDSESYSTIYVILCNTQGSWETQVLLPLVSPAGLSYLLKMLDACLWLIINLTMARIESLFLLGRAYVTDWAQISIPRKVNFSLGLNCSSRGLLQNPRRCMKKAASLLYYIVSGWHIQKSSM